MTHPESLNVTIDTYRIARETLQRYIAGLERKRTTLQTEARTIQERIDVRTIESAVCDNLELTDEQLSVLQEAKLAYVGVYGDLMDDRAKIKSLTEQIEALTALIYASQRLGGVK